MDDSFQFIIESPQTTTGHKKRPRLVTSCDSCRLKKIKCLQPSPETKCEACKLAKVPCRFRDRERYFAERSRAIAGGSSVSSTNYNDELRSDNAASLDAFPTSGVPVPEGEPNGRFQSYSPTSRRSNDSDRHPVSPQSIPPSYPQRSNYHVTSSPVQVNHRPAPRQVHLFDSDFPQHPHPTLTPHFIQIFFDRLGHDYPWISYEEVTAEYWERTLSPLLSNSIAALASRYSNLPELTVRGLHVVSDAYAENAKTLLSQVSHAPSFDTLHSLMLLAWTEYRANRIPGFRSYCAAATRMGMELGLSEQDQNTRSVNMTERERTRRRTTWQGLYHLHATSTSFQQ